ncbi:MAG: NUDIX domain-containing protein [Candidatus Absconditabacterales bacterium]
MTYTPNDSSRLISFTAPANDGTLSPKTLDPLPKSLHAILSQRVGDERVLYKQIDGECVPVRQITRVLVFCQQSSTSTPLFLLLFNGKHQYRQNPQGGVDPGEDYLQAGARELEEETGITELEFLDTGCTIQEYRSERKGKAQWSVVYGVAARTLQQDIVLNSEDGHTDYGRFTYDEACTRLTKFPEQLTLFEQLCRNAGLDK